VLSLALDKRTGDVWAGTMGGLSRISGGRIDSYTQLNSGLSNDVVYGVSVEGENVWVATAAGGAAQYCAPASGRSTTSATRP
jgi:ligand-binding sensor domain-containing protein